jgi:DNA modification methylase
MEKKIMDWPADKIERRKVDALIPYARNARTHSDEQVAQIAASIKEWGWTTPVLIDEDGEIIAGHGRVLAARKLAIDEIPTMTATGWSKAQKQAYVLADNQLPQNAGWDMDLLSVEMKDLDADGFDLSLIGFGDDMLANMLVDPTEGLTNPDAVPDVPENPVTVLGDVWLLGNHRVMCGDSTSIDAVERLMDGVKADMVFTDPPYALFGNSTGVACADDGMVRSFFRDILVMLKMQSKLFAHIYVCCDWHSAFAIEAVSRQIELKAKNLCIWDKGDGGVGAMYQQCYEMIWFFDNSPTQKTTMNTGKAGVKTVNGKPNIWRVKRHTTGRVHNAQKPVDLVSIPMLAGSDGGDCILDLFGGSGTTMISAEINGRKSMLMELDPKYCDVIVQRWQDFTGQQAKLEGSGETFPTIKENAT